MNKIFTILGLFLIVGAGCAQSIAPEGDLSGTINSQPTVNESEASTTEVDQKMSVLDHYQILPAEYIDHQYFYPEVRMEHIDVLDEDNYYIRIESLVQSNGGEYGAMTVFIKPNGQHIIAAEGGITTSLSFRTLYLLTYIDGKWTDVTNDLIPWNKINFDKLREQVHKGSDLEAEGIEAEFITFYFELPRYGTDLELKEYYSDETVLTLKWRNGRFYIK
ncbi:MAG: hypothetical protein ABH846_00130 [Patescibacteria group bacterium]